MVLCSGLNISLICWQAGNSAWAVTISALMVEQSLQPLMPSHFSIKQAPHISFLGPPKHHKLGGLRQQKIILFQYWRPEVWNQVVGRADSYWRPWGKTCFMLFSTFEGCQQSLVFLGKNCNLCFYLHVGFFPVCLCVSDLPLLSLIRMPIIGFRDH